jgi:ribosomal protein L35
MSKLKTHQATAKRFLITGRKKFMKRAAGQDHFNARDRGVTTMGKRRDIQVAKSDRPSIQKLVPYQ